MGEWCVGSERERGREREGGMEGGREGEREREREERESSPVPGGVLPFATARTFAQTTPLLVTPADMIMYFKKNIVSHLLCYYH
jgi:hypothetical protein